MLKSLSLASHNWKVLLKSILYQALLLAFVLASAMTLFGDLVDRLVEIFNKNHIQEFISQTISSIVAGTFDTNAFTQQLTQLIVDIQQSISSLQLPWGGATLSYVLFAVILVMYRLFVSLADVVVDCQLEEFMTSNSSRPFIWFFFKKQGRTWKFSLLQAAITLPLDLLIVFGCVGFYELFLIAFNWWTIIPVAIIGVLFYMIRVTIFSLCLPAVACEDMGVSKAFKKGLVALIGRFWHVFWKTAIVIALIVITNVLSLTLIHNGWVSTLVSTVPSFILFFYLKCVCIIEYFHADNRPFFHKRVDVEGTDRHNLLLEKQALKAQKEAQQPER